MRSIKYIVLFCAVTALHFMLSLAGVAFALPAAFESQAGFWAAPVKVSLVWIAGVLLWPLAVLRPNDFGFLDIAAVSVSFGIAAVALTYAVGRARRAGRRREG